jgi:menaquinone-dependent protoporphyrinogen IX oxidase
MKGLIIYKGKYGATRQYAVWLGNTLELPVVPAGAETAAQLSEADFVILGTSIYIGKLQLKKWIGENQAALSAKKIYLFLVTGTPLDEKEKLMGYIKNNVPEELRKRCKYFFFPGKLEFDKLSWSDKLLLKIGAWLSKGTKNEIPLADYNRVDHQYIDSLVQSVNYMKVK